MKKLLSILSICAAALIAIGAATPAAQATTVTATWTGTISNGADYGNNFGGFNVNDPVTLTSVFDTTTGSLSGDTITGGGTATLTIGSNSYTFSLSPSSYGYNAFGSDVLSMDDGAGSYIHASFWSAALPGSILTAFDGDTAPGYSFGTFQIVPGYTAGNFDVSHLTVAVSNTPIPATLPLFASSLLGLGFVARRKKAAAAI